MLYNATSANFPNLLWSVPGGVSALDTNGDGYADRLYFADVGGQVWRFDLTNAVGTTPLSVAGGVIGSFGEGPGSGNTSYPRRFFDAPDVALIQSSGSPLFMNVSIGSGFRQHPLRTRADFDRMYVIRDYSPLQPLTQTQYNNYAYAVDAMASASAPAVALIDVTTSVNGGTTPVVPVGSAGWQYDFGTGEKNLSSVATFNGQLLFNTYTPASVSAAASGSSCTLPSLGTNTFYDLTALSGAAGSLLNGSYSTKLQQTGIAPETTFMFPAPGFGERVELGGSSSGGGGGGQQRQVVCTNGVEILSGCKSFNTVLKTYWTENDIR